MTRQAGTSILALLLGTVAFAGMAVLGWGLQHLAFPTGSGPIPAWYAVVKAFSQALEFLPGFVAGYVASRGPLKHGLLLAVGTTLVLLGMTLVSMGSIPAEMVVRILFAGYLLNAVVSVVGAIVGVVARHRLIEL